MNPDSQSQELVIVHIAFSTTAYFDQEVTMRRCDFEKINKRMDDGECVDLTEYIDWDSPSGVAEDNDVETFEIVSD